MVIGREAGGVMPGARVLSSAGMKQAGEVKEGDELWTRGGWKEVQGVSDGGATVHGIVIRTASGFCLGAPETQLFGSPPAAIRARDISAGASLSVYPGSSGWGPPSARRLPWGKSTSPLGPDIGYVAGWCSRGQLAWDSFHSPSSFSVHAPPDLEAGRNFARCLDETLGGEREGGDIIFPVAFYKCLVDNGLHCPDRGVPPNVWRASSAAQMAYASGLFDAIGEARPDGWFFWDIFPSPLQELQGLLLASGIVSHISGDGALPKLGRVLGIRPPFLSAARELMGRSVRAQEQSVVPPSRSSLSFLDEVMHVEPCGPTRTTLIELEAGSPFWCEGFDVR